MAETLATFPFVRQGPNEKYPWDQWLDGQIWKATSDVDYHIITKSFRAAVISQARRKGKHARTSTVDDGKAVVFQAYDNPESEAPNGR